MAGNCLRNCDPLVKALCNRALASCGKKTHKKKNASLFLGFEINIFLLSVSLSFGTESRDGITTAANVVEDGKEY